MNIADLALHSVAWFPCHRLIAGGHPAVGVFDRVATPEDLEFVLAFQAHTDPQLRQELGRLSLVPAADRVVGPGATLIMSAFTHWNPHGSRFSNGQWGVYYAAESLETAVAEVSHHRARFLAATREPAIELDLRWVQAELLDKLHDLRGQRAEMPEVYDPDHYGASQALAGQLRSAGSAGVAYDSVRREGGQCAALFKPRALANASTAGHVGLYWNGRAVTHWYLKGEAQRL